MLKDKSLYLALFLVIIIISLSVQIQIMQRNDLNLQKDLKECKMIDTQIEQQLKQRENDINEITNNITTLQPKLHLVTAEWYAKIITEALPKQETRKILVAILFAESSFNHLRVNANRDYGLGQINYPVWSRVFDINKERLLNPIVNIHIAAAILLIHKITHEDKIDWYGYYHSSNKKTRDKYVRKINNILKRIQ